MKVFIYSGGILISIIKIQVSLARAVSSIKIKLKSPRDHEDLLLILFSTELYYSKYSLG